MESSNTVPFDSIKKVTLSNGETFAYREVGAGPQTLILVHGTMSSAYCWRDLASALAVDFRVISVDLRGFGHSTYNKPITTHEELADDLKLFVDELKISKFALMGWSTGGVVSFYFTVKHPELVEKLILFASVGPQGLPIYHADANGQLTKERVTKREDLRVHPMFAPICQAVENKNTALIKMIYDHLLFQLNKPEEKIYNTLLDEVCMQKHTMVINEANMTVNVTEEDTEVSKGDASIKKLKTPTLVIHGEKDDAVSVTDAKKWKSFAGDLVVEKVFSDATHNPLDHRMEDVVKEVKSFLLPESKA